MTPNEFEKWQKEKRAEEIANDDFKMTQENYEMCEDMLNLMMEDCADSNVILSEGGYSITENGLIVCEDKELIRYHKSLIKQQRDNHREDERKEHKKKMRNVLKLVK